VYRRTLVIWLSILGVMLIVLQLLLLRWSLTPLRKVASDMSRVERGDSEQLDSQYPLELTGLTERINAFIDNEREQRTRYRHTLADLAHSLKTPLAVIRSQLESAAGDEPVAAQRRARCRYGGWTNWSPTSCRALRRRADRPSPAPCRSPVMPRTWCRVWKRSMPPRTCCANSIFDDDAVFYGEQGDLLELMGNLLENAFKWAGHRVLLMVKTQPPSGRQRPGLR
jgi:two-component system sensor histidine kinase PhoQ